MGRLTALIVRSQVDVEPGTPAGTYTLIYEICEILNPSNCSDAPVFITVLSAVIAANDDNFNSNPIDCETGGVAGNVLGNDLLDGSAVDAADVLITLIDNGGITGASISANGDLNIPSGVAVGTYLLEYQICEVINPANCDIANIQITIYDTEDPTITCPADLAVNSDAGTCEATNVVIGTPTVNDNCGVNTVTGVRDDMLALTDPYPLGTTTITWTVTDFGGNSATCDQLVVVTDIELPTIVCPAPVAVNTDADECTASGVVLGTPTVDDNCSILSVTNDAPAVFPIGTTTVTWTVTDGSGNIATCEQIVTVTDIELPTIVCPAPVAVNTDADECTASGVVLGTPTVDDNCSILSVTNDAPAVFPIGTTTVTWTVTDGSGNIATCEQIVTVTDIELPTIVCPEDIVSCSNVIELVEPLVSDNCGIDQIVNNAPVIFPAGTTAVNWTVTDINGNISSCEQLVHVSLMNVDVEASSQVSCTDASDAVISVTVEGAFGEVTYSLNGGTPQASNIFEGLSAGEYTVLVEDENGCSVLTEVITITNPTQIEAEIIVSSQVSCFDGNDASIEVLATGGTGQFTYYINGGAPQTSNIFENLAAGTHTVVVEDENLCSTTLTDIVIENPEALQVSYTVQDEISCFGSEDGTIEVFVSGGSGVYTVVLTNTTNGQENSLNSSFIFDNLVAGSYTIRVTDSNGCSELINATLQTPEALELSYSPFCEAGIVGIELNANGGLGTPMFSIDGGQSWTESSSFTNLVNGTTLSLIATDANGCLTGIVNVPVESLNTLNASAEVVSENACYGVADAAIQINIVGGVAPYTFTVNGTDVHYSDLIASLNAGDYVIQIRDANECPAVTEISIESSEEIEIDLVSKTNADCNGNSDGTAEIDVSGGFGEFDYNWTNGSTGRIVADLNAGTHTVTVTDLRGCEVTYDVIIESDVIGVELVMNTVFTPNNDGINDHFVISNLEMYPENELVVINRWGNEVYSKKSYDNSWDGSNLTEGTYFYVLKVKMCDEYKTLNGYITILE
ncbi:MAG: HYR domain-containing protein [Bacteroidales bacterium]|nr:HYR domain-containing protein [Bacteroidales bacterium]